MKNIIFRNVKLIAIIILSITGSVSTFIFFNSIYDQESKETISLLSQEEVKEIKNLHEADLNSNKILVDIGGQVKNPGVIEVPQNVSLLEVINLAGGFTSEADLYYIQKNMNLAQVVKDRQKIYIPSINEGNSTNSSSLIDINTASSLELMKLPSIGSTTAENIIEARPFESIEDIKKVKGIGEVTFEKIKDKITVN